MATPITSKIQVRQGVLADLPMLSPGELGYAKDARRLFIGNDPIFRSGDGQDVNFNFGVDLDVVYDGAFEILVNGVPKQRLADWVSADYVVTFTVAPPAGTNNIELRYNTELLTFEPDKTVDAPMPTLLLQRNPSFFSETDAIEIPAIQYDSLYNDYIDIKYMLKNAAGEIRKGVISVGIDRDSNNLSVHDNFNTNAFASFDHHFDGTISTEGVFTLTYQTAFTDEFYFSYILDDWKSKQFQP